MPPTTTTPRWQDDTLSISFRSCKLSGFIKIGEALTAQSVTPDAIGHLDLGENELSSITELTPFTRLLSLDIAHNSVDELPATALSPSLHHLNAAYNRLESAAGVANLTQLIELNLSYNLLTSCAPFEKLTQLQVLLLGGNRISSLVGLEGLAVLELLDVRFNYIEKQSELRLLALNATLRTLTLQGNPLAKSQNYRASVATILPTLLTLDGQKMPRSSAQRQSGSFATQPSTLSARTAFTGGHTTTVSRPKPMHKPVRSHTRYGAALDPTKQPAPTPHDLKLMPAPPLGTATVSNLHGHAPPGSVSLAPRALNTSLLRSSAAPGMQFAPATQVTAGGWQPASPRASPRRSSAEGGGGGGGGGGSTTPASARHAAAAAATAAAANLAAEQQGGSTATSKPPPSTAGSTRRRLLVGDGKAEARRTIAAAVASKEAATLASKKGGSEAVEAAPGLSTPVHRAPAPFQNSGATAAASSAAAPATTTVTCPPSAAAAAPTFARAQQLRSGKGEMSLSASTASFPSFLRRGSGHGGGNTSARTTASGATTRTLVRSSSAEGLRPTKKAAAADSSIPYWMTTNVSPPLLKQHTSTRTAALDLAGQGVAQTSAWSAEKGLMELAFEIGCGIKVQKGVFVPAESPITLLESLLKMQAA